MKRHRRIGNQASLCPPAFTVGRLGGRRDFEAWRPSSQASPAGTKPLEAQRGRLTAWYEQFVQRSQPFIGWLPLKMAEFGAHDPKSSFGITQAEERISRTESPMSSKESPPSTRLVSVTQNQASPSDLRRFPAKPHVPEAPFELGGSILGPVPQSAKPTPPGEPLADDPSARHERQMEVALQPVAPPIRQETSDHPAEPTHASEQKQLSPGDGRLAPEDWGPLSPRRASQGNQEQPLVRPPLRLAILRPINTAAGTVQRKESVPLSSGTGSSAMAETRHLGLEHWPIAAQLAVQSRLASSMSSPQRPEVHGGFPGDMKGEVRLDVATSSDDPVRAALVDSSAFRNDEVPEPGPLGRPRETESAGPPALPPVSLPGIQIRLLRPDESAIQPSLDNVAKPGRSTIASSKTPTPPAAAPPPLDINAVADKVYQVLQRRHQLERERRGLY